ncbi:Uncharacterised protein [Mycobacterium tuberculosis]|nr:Uncharacterised protein [Mycobacterium tuberculosis]
MTVIMLPPKVITLCTSMTICSFMGMNGVVTERSMAIWPWLSPATKKPLLKSPVSKAPVLTLSGLKKPVLVSPGL